MEEDSEFGLLDFECADEEEESFPSDLAQACSITEEEWNSTNKVLRALVAQPDLLQHPFLKSFRTMGIELFLKNTSSFYGGAESRKDYVTRKEKRKEKHRKRQMMRQLDFNHQNACKLRRERIEALSKQVEYEAAAIPMLEDTRIEESAENTPVHEDSEEEEQFIEEVTANDLAEEEAYFYPKSCYTCKARFLQRHHFYDRLCPDCAELNWTKRTQRADLSGRVVILTGGRVKIGFQAGLKLLRDGCEVILTTRFPQNAASRYLEMEDSGEWAHRLHVYGLDLRDLGAIQRFTDFIKNKFNRLDAIINNAAQTVRRPTAYYRHLLPEELAEPGEKVKTMLLQPHTTKESLSYFSPEGKQVTGSASDPVLSVDASTRSALLSQVPVAEEDWVDDQRLFPQGQYDVDKQQLDLRMQNSWKLKAEEVPSIELVEVHCVNVMAPFILNGQLKSLMEGTPAPDRFIVNVSAMEGKFYRSKTPFHPHTNMAKAGLNMMTKTCAEDYARSCIYMNSIDTGWIHDENPFHLVQHNLRTGFQTPIDEVDAAARILDPIYLSALHQQTPYGKFLKDYKETSW